jgi:two-component system sensor histidine kinase MprB
MLNLLDNACKYGPAGQTVATRAWRSEGRICVSVRDAGPGIPDQDKQNVWLPYRRLIREEERALNGTGIGLSVARELILAMGGEYRVEDAEGGGARFVISFQQAESEIR